MSSRTFCISKKYFVRRAGKLRRRKPTSIVEFSLLTFSISVDTEFGSFVRLVPKETPIFRTLTFTDFPVSDHILIAFAVGRT